MARELSTPHTFQALAEEALLCLEESEKAHNKANARRAQLRSGIVEELVQQHVRVGRKGTVSEAQIDVVVNKRVGEDARWKSHASMNKWMIERSTMYSSAALVLAEWERRMSGEE
jgi:hypothetical protein